MKPNQPRHIYGVTILAILCLVAGQTIKAQSPLVADSALITISSQGKLWVNGSVEMTNNSTIDNNGLVELKGDWINNSNDTTLKGNGKVLFSGGAQQVQGNYTTTFHDVTLSGTGVKALDSSIYVNGILDIQDRVLNGQTYFIQINNANSSAIQYTTGHITFSPNGRLIRNTNTTTGYIFPLGDMAGTTIRPVILTPDQPGNNTYSVGYLPYNPTRDGYNVANRDSVLCVINDQYYHVIDHLIGTAGVVPSISYNPILEGPFSGLAQWGGIQWDTLGNALSNNSGSLQYIELADPVSLNGETAFGLSNKIGTPVITTTGNSFCFGDTVTVNATPGYNNYFWSNGATGSSVDITNEGTIQVLVDSAGSCFRRSAPLLINMDSISAPQISLIGDSVLCFGDSVILYTTGSYASYQWSDGSTDTFTTTMFDGSYNLTVSDTNGCSASATSAVQVSLNFPITPIIQTNGPASFCPGDSVTAFVDASFSNVVWSTGHATDSLVITQGGSYGVQVIDSNGCASGRPNGLTVGIYQPDTPVFSVGDTNDLCVDDSISISINNTYGNQQWNTGITNDTIWSLNGGTYFIDAVDSNGCIVTDTIRVGKDLQDTVMAGFTYIITDSTIEFTNTSYNAHSYLWNFFGRGTTTDTHAVFNLDTIGSLKFCLTATNNCYTDSICTSIAISGIHTPKTPTDMQLIVYPNPTNGQVTVSWGHTLQAAGRLELYNLLGQQIQTQELIPGLQQTHVNLNDLPAGQYYVRVVVKGRAFTQKIEFIH